MRGLLQHRELSARWTSRPVTSPACTTRRALWPPSRVRSSSALAIGAPADAAEVGAERDQLAHALGPVAHHHLDHVAVREAAAGLERVLHVALEGVGRVEHRGDAALRVGGRRLVELALGHDQHVGVARGLEREGQPGDAAADDR